ncbi:MAG: hypothetical protein JWM68_4937 [Verrucomicrobiales bacterium]|nr:hypothetical protein [Verrucomicrobiales bacterium]
MAVSRSTRFFLGFFILVGVVILGVGVWTTIQSIRSKYWPVTEGVIQSANIQSHKSSEGETTYSAAINYTYQVNGKGYWGDKIAFGGRSSSLDDVQAVLGRYPVGKKVPVHYSPNDASVAVLQTGIHGGTWLMFFLVTVFVVLGVATLREYSAIDRAEAAGTLEAKIMTLLPSGRIGMDKPPVFMGVVFLTFGLAVCVIAATSAQPTRAHYIMGGMVALAGVFLLLCRLEKKVYSKIAMVLLVATMLGFFHWISFGSIEGAGSNSGRGLFAMFILLFDAVLVGSWTHWFLKRKRD